MSSEGVLEQIGAPLPGDMPAGVDMRLDRSFHKIKDARDEASRIEKRAKEDLGDRNKPEKERVTRSQSVAYWKTVADLGKKALATRTKDLAIASYVIEAVVRTDGFAGLADALRWTRRMVENCWDTLYPVPEPEEGVEITPWQVVENRILPLSQLSSSSFIEAMSWVEITGVYDPGPFCYWQYRQALKYEACNEEEKVVRQNRGTVTMAQFDAAVKQTGDNEYRELIQSVIDCQLEYEALIAAVTGKVEAAGLEEPPTVTSSDVQDELKNCLGTLRHITKGRSLEPNITASTVPAVPGPNGGTVPNANSNGVRTREDAFRELNHIAEFFEKAEPQSLIPAQIRKVVRLGRLSPAEFFAEIVEEEAVRNQLFKIHGLKQLEQKDEASQS